MGTHLSFCQLLHQMECVSCLDQSKPSSVAAFLGCSLNPVNWLSFYRPLWIEFTGNERQGLDLPRELPPFSGKKNLCIHNVNQSVCIFSEFLKSNPLFYHSFAKPTRLEGVYSMVSWFAILAISTQWERGYSGERNENVIHVVSLSVF
jgi:hypothetical protein